MSRESGRKTVETGKALVTCRHCGQPVVLEEYWESSYGSTANTYDPAVRSGNHCFASAAGDIRTPYNANNFASAAVSPARLLVRRERRSSRSSSSSNGTKSSWRLLVSDIRITQIRNVMSTHYWDE